MMTLPQVPQYTFTYSDVYHTCQKRRQ